MQPATITVEQAAQELGVSRNAAYAAVNAGEIPAIRIGRRWLVPKIAFQKLLQSAGQEKPDRDPKAA